MPRLNVMGELRAILESALGGVPVRVDLPGERPGTVVVVRRCGGARQDALVDSPQVEVLTALAVECAPSLERRQGHDPERLHGVPLAHAAVDHGRGGGDLLLVCVPGLLAVHG